MASPLRPPARRFSETIRLPRRYLVPWVVFDCAYAVFFTWLWAIATMTQGQRVVIAVFIGATIVLLFGGALWFVAMRVVVSERDLTRRVGHRRARVPVRDIARCRVEDTTQSGLDRVVLTLRDGSEEKVLSHRAEEMITALGHLSLHTDGRTAA